MDSAHQPKQTVVIGAGIAGLAAALRLSHAGRRVTVIDAATGPGGKMRTVASNAGPVDTGPTVLTMRPVFEDLFASIGEKLSDHITLTPLKTLARHHWDDGTTLDLMADHTASCANIRATFGVTSEAEFRQFSARAKRLYDAFDGPMMLAAQPSQIGLTARVLKQPRLIGDMAPHRALGQMLNQQFSEPKLAQLFARYATYVGGSPNHAPALLALIADAEARGVWAVKGGMHTLATCLMTLAQQRGTDFVFNTKAEKLIIENGKVTGVETSGGTFNAATVVFNGDPNALATGLLGPAAQMATPAKPLAKRSLSAWVHAFAAKPTGPDLAYHTVFFGHDPSAEFDALDAGQTPTDATLYVCAQDRATGTPTGEERFEIILNGPPLRGTVSTKDIEKCQTQVFNRLAAFGLTFDPQPGATALSTPQTFATLYPASQGSLYGQSPHGLTAGLKRPTARTRIKGLYLCGGGTHPGAGVPMATLSARHVAEAILADQTSTSTSPKTATHGGTSTASAQTANARSPSSAS